MGDESIRIPSDNIEYHIVTLFEKIEALRHESPKFLNLQIQQEVRALEFWRSVLCECLASFCYVFIVCGAVVSAGPGASVASVLFATALAGGLSMTVLTQCFVQVSGAHINPAVTVAMVITRNTSLFRAIMFIIAQCGGGIAGAAFLYGMSAPAYQGNLSTALTNTNNLRAWERFGIEFILSFMIVLTYLTTMKSYTKWLGGSSLTIGAAYAACTFVSMPYLNPARSLGPSFVLSKWENHWVYWIAPITGGAISGLVYEYILNPHTHRFRKNAPVVDSCAQSEEDPYDDLEKPSATKCSTSYKYRPGGNAIVTSTSSYSPPAMPTSFYSAPLNKLERAESVYGGTKSLYCKSPPLTRANLNRSQSVYAKTNSGNLKDSLPRAGPLIPTQSLYSIRLNQQSHAQNQNVQNQMHQRTDKNTKPVVPLGATAYSDGYNTVVSTTTKMMTNDNDNHTKFDDSKKMSRRPDSLYGMPRHLDECNYSYYGSVKRANADTSPGYSNNTSIGNKFGCHTNAYTSRNTDIKHLPPSNSFHHILPQHSPSSQY